MPCSVTFLLEVSEPVSLKVNSKDYFRGKNVKILQFGRYSSKLKNEEGHKIDLNISGQIEILIFSRNILSYT